MAGANAPCLLVELMEGATEATVEQVIMSLNRMASESAVRGLIVQQGALTACLKVEKGDFLAAMCVTLSVGIISLT
jgi:hypothetical protein